MKLKIVLCLLMVVCLYENSMAIFGIEKALSEISLLKVDVAKNAQQLAKFDTDMQNNFNLQMKMINDIRIDLKADIKAQGQAIAGVNNKVSSIQSTESVGGNKTISSVNDSAIFIRYVEAQEKLSNVYEKITLVLIGQLCALLTLFIRKDWSMDIALAKKDDKINSMLINLISEDEAREDAKEMHEWFKKDIKKGKKEESV